MTALPSFKPSPFKRRCSDENALLPGEENKQSVASQLTAYDPITDQKPPLAPTTVRPIPVEQRAAPDVLPTRPPPDTEKMVVCPPQSPAKSTDNVRRHYDLDGARETQKDAPTTVPSSMRSRLQRLANQRQNWDSNGRKLFVNS